MASPILTIDILRHGQTNADSGKLYGATDIPLSDEGKVQLLKAAQAIHQEPIAQVVSSPLQRCAWLLEKFDSQIPTTVHAGFAEMDFGEWEGENIRSLIAQEPNFRADVTQLNPINGERFTDFATRVLSAWQQYIDTHISQGGHHLLVTHGGVMRVLLGQVLHVPNQYLSHLYIPHAAWSRITFAQGEPPMLWFMNHHA